MGARNHPSSWPSAARLDHQGRRQQPGHDANFLYWFKPRLRSAPPGALPAPPRATLLPPARSARAAPTRAHVWIGPEAMSRSPQNAPTGQRHASGGGAQAPRWRGRRLRVPAECGVHGELPSRLPSTQAEPSSRGPGRQGRSYSGALHLDALNHARSTVCGSTADGMEAGEGGGRGRLLAVPQSAVGLFSRSHVSMTLRLQYKR